MVPLIFKSTPNDNGRLLKFAIEISFKPAHQWRHGYLKLVPLEIAYAKDIPSYI